MKNFVKTHFGYAYKAILELETKNPDWIKKTDEVSQKRVKKYCEKRFSGNQNLFRGLDYFYFKKTNKKKIQKQDKLEFLHNMTAARCVDNATKKLFLSSEIKYKERGFQGKGFRCLGQEAIAAAAWSMNMSQEKESGDMIAPMIRDLPLTLNFLNFDYKAAVNYQFGKDCKPYYGKDISFNDYDAGVLGPGAPLAMSLNTLVGVAKSFKIKKEKRVCFGFSGDGTTSQGEWHEAINMACAQSLPMVFTVQNNQTALSTKISSQTAVKKFSDKALGYGIFGLTIDGNDPEEIALTYKWAREEAALGRGPILIELITMRMCGHAHHDDMLYLGYEPEVSLELSKLDNKGDNNTGYVDKKLYEKFRKKDPIFSFAKKLEQRKIVEEDYKSYLKNLEDNINAKINKAIAELKKTNWPEPNQKAFEIFSPVKAESNKIPDQAWNNNARASRKESYLNAIGMAVTDAMRQDSKIICLGEDIAAPYGNAFMLFKQHMKDLEDRFENTPISESAIIGAAVGMALEGYKPIAEMQFNDFVATGFNQVVNNAAKLFFRTGLNLPMVIRMPWGGLRSAGPYHSQDTSPWFYRTAGLKIVAPSTPADAYGLMLASIADPNPVLFYEHINLYRDPNVKENLGEKLEEIGNMKIGQAKLVHEGSDLTVISYGAYVQKAHEIIKNNQNISTDLIDLRTLNPIDFELISQSIKKTNKVILLGEDSVQGSILESIAAQISDKLFEYLDAPVRVLGARNTPVPYAPSLEEGYLLSSESIIQNIREILDY